MPRLFIAIDLPDDQRTQLAELCRGIEGAKWVKPEQIHLTLRFIGDADDDTKHLLQIALAEIAAPPLTLQLRGAGTFPPLGHKPRVLWFGVAENPALMHLQQSVEAAVKDCGIPAESRPWTPHITLARFKAPPGKDLQRWLEANAGLQLPPFMIGVIHLYQSRLERSGAIHNLLQTIALHL
jgi:RNA 2',3'-cyclic 3'-phosphodiesterase